MRKTKKDIQLAKILMRGIELCGCWLLVVFAGLALMIALMSQQQKTQQLVIQEKKLTLGLQNLQEAIATDISMGVEIEDNPRIEHMLTQMLESDPSLQSANVINQRGLVMYSTNLAQLETQLPSQLLTVIHQQSATKNWQLRWGSWWFFGIPLSNAHAEEVGHIFLSKAAETSPSATQQDSAFNSDLVDSLAWPLFASFIVCTCIVFLLGCQACLRQRKSKPQLQETLEVIRQAQHQIQRGFDDLDMLERNE